MPTYDYQCQECGQFFEVFATFKQKEAGLQPVCPICQSEKMQQTFRTLMFIRSDNDGGSLTMASGCPTCGPGGC